MIITLDSLRETVPSIFAKSPSPKLSDRYAFADSEYYLNKFIDNGWNITSAKQISKSVYAPHQVVLRHNANANVGDLLPQLLFVNSHNGIQKMNLNMGIYRLVCSNGLTVPSSVSQSLSIKHLDLTNSFIDSITESFFFNIPTVMDNVNRMRNKMLNNDEIMDFSSKAINIRFTNPNDIDLNDIINPVRREDTSKDLWTVFNVVQEKLIKGGVYRKNTKRRSRAINNFLNDSKINTQMWELAEQYV